GRNYASFEAAQNIPYELTDGNTQIVLDPLANETSFLSNVAGWDDGTDASCFMTICE
ncbi:hypothetical protein HK100_007718, partial [Physocladia obscura]